MKKLSSLLVSASIVCARKAMPRTRTGDIPEQAVQKNGETWMQSMPPARQENINHPLISPLWRQRS